VKGEKGDPGLSAPIYPDAQNCSCSKGEKGLKGKRGKTGSQVCFSNEFFMSICDVA